MKLTVLMLVWDTELYLLLKKSPLAPLCPGYIHFLRISFYCEIFGCGRARVAATPPPQFSEVATTHKHQSEEGAG